MADETKKQEQKAEAANERVQQAMDEVTDQGFYGVKVDPTPNENYTVAGVTGGKPTPESDPGQADNARSTKFR